jgi:hypothetical protein
MDPTKLRKIETKLFQLVAQIDSTKEEKTPKKSTVSRVKVIRRRKGKPDLHIT